MNVLKEKRSKHKRKRKPLFNISSHTTINSVLGVRKIFLSPLTQNNMKCRIGVDITAIQPWIYVPKEKILNNIKLYDRSSELLPLKEVIEAYPGEDIFMGCYSYEQDKAVEFMICTTLEATEVTLESLQKEEKERQERLLLATSIMCGAWRSFGSEKDVNDNMNLNFRKLFTVQLTFDNYWLQKGNIFEIQMAANIKNGYVQLISNRQIYNNIKRRRISSYVQCAPYKVDANVQAIPKKPCNKNIQHDIYTYLTGESSKCILQDLLIFLKSIETGKLYDIIETISNIDLLKDEYLFLNRKQMNIFKLPDYILSLQEMSYSRGKKVSCLTWNAMMSGLIATAYITEPLCTIIKAESVFDPSEVVHGNHIALVWSYTDPIKPHLILHSDREITALSFCSYNANIIVGGCENGQITVWDITGRLEKVERLLEKQLQYTIILQPFTDWMKQPPGIMHVYPVIVSNIDLSHKTPVSDIHWISPDKCISSIGKYTKRKSDEVHMQFISCSINAGNLLAWDISVNNLKGPKFTRKRIVRLSRIPESLTKDESPLKVLRKSFQPISKLYVSDENNHTEFLITSILKKQAELIYSALESEAQMDTCKRTYFECKSKKIDKLNGQEFILSSLHGQVCRCQWNGLHDDQDSFVNSDIALVRSSNTVHNGPIIVCIENPVIKDIFITIGGNVFALWDARHLKNPVFWRKNSIRYVAASWFGSHVFQFSLVRCDSNVEIWNLMDDSKAALKIFRWKGYPTVGLFYDLSRMHSNKETFAVTTSVGEIKIFLSKCFKNETEEVVNYINHIQMHKKVLKNWTELIKNKKRLTDHDQTEEQVESSTKHQNVRDTVQVLKIKSIPKISSINKWQMKQEKIIRTTLLERNNLNFKEIMMNAEMLTDIEKTKHTCSVKVANEIKKGQKVIAKCRIALLSNIHINIRKKITVHFPKDISEHMKHTYIENYKNIERQTLHYIKVQKHVYFFNWADSVTRATKIRNASKKFYFRALSKEKKSFRVD